MTTLTLPWKRVISIHQPSSVYVNLSSGLDTKYILKIIKFIITITIVYYLPTVRRQVPEVSEEFTLFQFKTTGGKVLIYLKDDGIGFNPKTIVKGNGSQTQMRRAAAISANFSIISKPGGPTETKLEFTLWAKRQYDLAL